MIKQTKKQTYQESVVVVVKILLNIFEPFIINGLDNGDDGFDDSWVVVFNVE